MLLSVTQLCPYKLEPLGELSFRGQTVSGHEGHAVATTWRATAAEFELSIHDVRWEGGERDVRASDVTLGRPAIHHLGKGHRRLGVYAHEDCLWAELRMVQIRADDSNEWTTLLNAGTADWDEVLGSGWHQRLEHGFGVQVGTKARLIGSGDQTRERLCVRLPVRRDWVLPHLFLLTRVLPLVRGMTKRSR
jgi:hypothetical protein